MLIEWNDNTYLVGCQPICPIDQIIVMFSCFLFLWHGKNFSIILIDDDVCPECILLDISHITAVLSRCIGDLSTMPQCKSTTSTTPIPWAQSETSGQTCVRNPKAAQESLLNSATAIDSYVGWIAASWVTYFTRNERDTHVVGVPRLLRTCNCLMHLDAYINPCLA